MRILLAGLLVGFVLGILCFRFPQKIMKSPRVFCWVPVRQTKGRVADIISNTWISTCDGYVIIHANETKGLWNLVHPAWSLVAHRFGAQYDWFVKLDDDSYFSAENFKHLVSNFNPHDYYYLGHAIYSGSHGFNLGGGYALSQALLRSIAPYLPTSSRNQTSNNHNNNKCEATETWYEDVEMSKCLHLIAAAAGTPNNSRDVWHRETFMAFTPENNLFTVRRT